MFRVRMGVPRMIAIIVRIMRSAIPMFFFICNYLLTAWARCRGNLVFSKKQRQSDGFRTVPVINSENEESYDVTPALHDTRPITNGPP